MSKPTLHPIKPESWFLEKLKEIGEDWENPGIQKPTRNLEAHNVLPTFGSPHPDSTHQKSVAITRAAGTGPSSGLFQFSEALGVLHKWVSLKNGLLAIGTILFLLVLTHSAFSQDFPLPPIDQQEAKEPRIVVPKKHVGAASSSSDRLGDHHPPIFQASSKEPPLGGRPHQVKKPTLADPDTVKSAKTQKQPIARPDEPQSISAQAKAPATQTHFVIKLQYVEADKSRGPLDLVLLGLLALTTLLISALALLAIVLVRARHPKGASSLPQIEPKEQKPVQVRKTDWTADGATRTGLVREENQDAFCAGTIKEGIAYLVVCDGVGGEPGGREASHFASKFCRNHLINAIGEETSSSKLCAEAIIECQQAFDEKQVAGLTTAIVALIDDDQLHFACLGDGGLDIIHSDGIVQHCLAPHHAIDAPSNVITKCLGLGSAGSIVPRQGSISLELGSLVLAMSDGASDWLPIQQIATRLPAYANSMEEHGIRYVANQLLLNIENARDEETDALLHTDNMTLAIAKSDSV